VIPEDLHYSNDHEWIRPIPDAEGDTVRIGITDYAQNSLGDIVCCALGFALAVKLGWRWSIAVFLMVEVVLLFWIRDSLLLEILMLIHPVNSIKGWQLGH